jgi:pimeloyl-ACP methyl ester carboxylesterase
MNLVLGGVLVYGLAVGGLYLLQDSLIFPRKVAARPAYPLPAGAERLMLRTSDGATIVGALLRSGEPHAPLLLGFPGNAWNADDLLVFLARRVRGFDIAVFHYRGYPPSEGDPSEEALHADALLIHDTLVARLEPRMVVSVGFSLGSAVAARLAAQRPVRGLVLFTPFDSIEAIASKRYFWVPVRQLLRHPFRAAEALRGLAVPVAVVLASDDRVVPRERSEALIEALAWPVRVETVPGSTHAGLYDLPEVDDALRRALHAVVTAADPTLLHRDAPLTTTAGHG